MLPDTLIEGEDHRWTLSSQNQEELFGIFDSMPEVGAALHDLGMTLDDIDFYIPLERGIPSGAYNPFAPIGWESLTPQPTDISFPAVTESEMRRVMNGSFRGFRFTGRVDPNVNYTLTTAAFVDSDGCCKGTTTNITYSGESEHKVDCLRGQKQPCWYRDCTKPPTYASGTWYSPTPHNPGYAHLSENLTNIHGELAVTRVLPDPSCIDDPENPPTCSDDPVLVDDNDSRLVDTGHIFMGFYRNALTKQTHLWFLAGVGGAEASLWCYAPVSGADFHEIYGIPGKPEDTGNCTFHEITGAGPTVLGVALAVWGWSKECDHTYEDPYVDVCCGDVINSDLGTETYTPSLEIVEL
jgi:hypothetical protein